MHLPDGFLDAKTALLSTGAATAGVAFALRQVRTTLPPRRLPMLGLAAAFVFAAQMVNFPVAGGTSGHLLGGVLTAVLRGPRSCRSGRVGSIASQPSSSERCGGSAASP